MYVEWFVLYLVDECNECHLQLHPIHEAPRVILDAPTAAVDPVLRLAICKYLLHLVNSSNITIIITAHNTEEAKSPDGFSLMKSSQLLTQVSPLDLLRHFN